MALLELLSDGTQFRFSRSGVIGRSPSCELCLRTGWTSGEHAALRWTGKGWELRDLGSKNGTFVDRVRLHVGQKVLLVPGMVLAFGQPSERWLVRDVGQAEPAARSGAEVQFGSDGILVLPDVTIADACVYFDENSGWRCENRDEEWSVADGDTVAAGGRIWRLELPVAVGPTRDGGLSLADAQLVMRVNATEDNIEAELMSAGQRRVLGHRAHSSVLLHLARERLRSVPDVPESERGWLNQEELARRLGLRTTHLNVAVYRAREQARLAGFVDADQLIERRRNTGQLRLKVSTVVVEPL